MYNKYLLIKLFKYIKFRLFVKRGMSIKYLLPNPVIDYIHAHKLYLPKPKLEQS